MAKEIETQSEEKQNTSDGGRPNASEAMIPPRWREKVKLHQWKILAGILGFFVFAGAVFGAYKLGQRQVSPEPVEGPTPTPVVAATPTPNPTANWKAYTNTKYGYSIKYPSGWFCENFGQLDPKTLDHVGFHPSPPVNEFTAIAIDITSRTYEQQLQLGVQQSEPISVGEVQGVKKVEESPSGEIFIQVVLPNPSYTFILISKREHEDTFNLMLSTFRFISEESAGQRVFCEDPRPQVCTMECIVNPPYICGSDRKSYCTGCSACLDPKVEWYVIQSAPCGIR